VGAVRDDEPLMRTVPEEEFIRMKAELEAKVSSAEQEEYSRGHEAGLSKGRLEAQGVAAKLNQAVLQIEKQRHELLNASEKECTELSLRVARKIIDEHVKLDPEIVHTGFKKAVALLLDKSRLILKVSPDQHQMIRSQLDTLYSFDDSIERIDLEADPRVGDGGCVVETESGNVNARIESQFQIISDAISEVFLETNS